MNAALHDGYSRKEYYLSGPFVKGFSRKQRTYLDIQGDVVLALEFGEPSRSVQKTFQIAHLKERERKEGNLQSEKRRVESRRGRMEIKAFEGNLKGEEAAIRRRQED